MQSTAAQTRTSIRRSPVGAGHEVSIRRGPASAPSTLTEADARWPGRLRRIVRASLLHWGCPGLCEVAELMVTELSTNALRHSQGDDISVRIYLRDARCVIEVNDGSPARPELNHPAATDESGRGLFLVEAMSDSWGVSDDGTTTWCEFSLPEGPTEMKPAATTAPVLRELPLDLPADPSAVNAARVKSRTLLTMLGWPGNQHAAIDVIHCLVDNAVRHGLTPVEGVKRLDAGLGVTEAHELLIDVTDPNPSFPEFGKAIAGELGRGLWNATQHGAEITWFLNAKLGGKTVRAVMRPGPVEL
ncbi:anti-sigma regulatory factor [Streptomyces sp. AC512_CC834]|uniref:ATP-binding protein n=1 Tax=Streptomyces sp. AC512_CC834 TaxID=2823691 RepID=UPI001C2597BE|nr:ATP-binding protein [Streptomyces sp. AC512_CC834]